MIDDSELDKAITDAVDSTGFDLTTSGNTTGTTVERINKDGKVIISGGKNIQLSQSGNTITVNTADKVEFTDLTVSGDTKLGKTEITGDTTYTGAITGDTHIVNKAYVDSNRTVVKQGNNVTVAQSGNEYTVNANDTIITKAPNTGVTVTGGDLNANGERNYTIAVDTAKLTVQPDGSVQTTGSGNTFATAEDVANAINTTYWTASDGTTASKVKAGDTVVWRGENGITVTNNGGTGDFVISDNTKYTSTITGLKLDKVGDTVTLSGSLPSGGGSDHITTVSNTDKNLSITPTVNGDTTNYEINLNNKLDLGNNGEVKMGDVVINNGGLNNGGNKITHVAAGVDDTDAVNVGQLKQVTNIVTGGKDSVDIVTYNVQDRGEHHNQSVIEAIDNINAQGIQFFHTNQTGVTLRVDQTNDQDSSAAGAYATAIGVKANASEENTLAMGHGATASAVNAIAIGNGAQATGEKSISIGAGNIVSGARSGAIGDPNVITGSDSWALGNENTISTNNTHVVGNNIKTTADNSVFLGNNTAYTAAGASTAGTETYDKETIRGKEYTYAGGTPVGVVSVGGGIDADGNIETRRIQNVAAGKISADSTDAINGSQLFALQDTVNNLTEGAAGPVQYSNADGDRTGVSGPTNDVTLVGKEAAPVTIHNVAAGRAPTDAVNVGQLNQAVGNIHNRIDGVSKHADASAASAIAVASMPQAFLPGKNLVAIGGGTYHGQTGYAIGFSTISDNGHWIVKGTATGNSKNRYGAGVGAGYQW